VSNSWGGSEFSGESFYDVTFTAGLAYFVASEDSPGTSYPAASPNVVAVGGTSISRSRTTGNSSGKRHRKTAVAARPSMRIDPPIRTPLQKPLAMPAGRLISRRQPIPTAVFGSMFRGRMDGRRRHQRRHDGDRGDHEFSGRVQNLVECRVDAPLQLYSNRSQYTDIKTGSCGTHRATPLVANHGWVASPVKAVSRRRRGPQARPYRACHPAILGHLGRRLAT
jgi:hypothetical protein